MKIVHTRGPFKWIGLLIFCRIYIRNGIKLIVIKERNDFMHVCENIVVQGFFISKLIQSKKLPTTVLIFYAIMASVRAKNIFRLLIVSRAFLEQNFPRIQDSSV